MLDENQLIFVPSGRYSFLLTHLMQTMSTSSQNGKALGYDDFSHADDPLVKYSNIITDVDDLNVDDLSNILAGRESCCGTPVPLTRAGAFAREHVNTVSIGSNDDASHSVQSGSNVSFPLLLHSIVSDEAFDNVIHWLPCGKRFIISNKKEFALHALPLIFGGRRGGSLPTTKFSSFTRRLKRWNFSRIPSGCFLGAYYHEYFQKDQPELAKKIMYPMGSSSLSINGKSGSQEIVKKTSSRSESSPILSQRKRAESSFRIHVPFSEDSVIDTNSRLSSAPYKSEVASLPLLMDSKENDANPCPDVDASPAFNDPELLFDMFPSSTSSKRWSTQEDASTASTGLGRQMCYHCMDVLSMQRAENLHVARSYYGPYSDPTSVPGASGIPEVETLRGKSFSPNNAML